MKKIVTVFLLALFFLSCNPREDLKLLEIETFFESAQINSKKNKPSIVTLKLSRVSNDDVRVVLNLLTAPDLVYGEGFKSFPEAVNGKIELLIPAGKAEASLSLEIDPELIDDDVATMKSIGLNILEVNSKSDLIIGEQNSTKVLLGRIVFSGAETILDGLENKKTSSVYFNFSDNMQTRVPIGIWDLGFYCGDKFRVILNIENQVVGWKTGKTDIQEVGLDDAKNAPAKMGGVFMTFDLDAAVSLEFFDSFDGDINKTLIDEIAVEPDDNSVYLVAFGSEEKRANHSEWFKLKIERKPDGYLLHFAKVGDSEIKSVELKKDEKFNFIHFSLEEAEAKKIEPEKQDWNLEYTAAVDIRDMKGVLRPFQMNDVFLINNFAGAEAAEVLVSSIPYEQFSKNDLPSLIFKAERNAIGSKWRGDLMMGEGIKKDRYFVVKDTEGYIYKLRFLQMGRNDGGVRGKPKIEFELVK